MNDYLKHLNGQKVSINDFYKAVNEWKEDVGELGGDGEELAIYRKKDNPVPVVLNDFSRWLIQYNKLHHIENLEITPIFDNSTCLNVIRGTMLISNGQNRTKFTRQSLKHIYDIAEHLEDFYGASVWLDDTQFNFGKYLYLMSFSINLNEDHDNLKKLKWKYKNNGLD